MFVNYGKTMVCTHPIFSGKSCIVIQWNSTYTKDVHPLQGAKLIKTIHFTLKREHLSNKNT